MKFIRKMTSVLAAGAVLSAMAATAGAATSESAAEPGYTGIWPEIAGENSTSYDNLFDVILDDQYSYIWEKYCNAVVGEDNGGAVAASLKGSISSPYYGQEAIDHIAETGAASFDCWYINDAAEFTFNADQTAAIKLTDGTESTHTYEYIGQYTVGSGETLNWGGVEMDPSFPCDVYKSADEAGEFNYFFFRDDTMASTYHIEFRYGSDLENLQGYFKGKYAYWLSAGISADADEKTIDDVISLFCLENMDFSERTDSSLAQISDMIGTWDADLSSFGDAYADTELYFVIDENGHGDTYMNGEKTRDFSAYMYDSGDKGDGEGVYVAYDNEAFEAESAEYTLSTNENGDLVLTLTADDGVISYVKRGAEATAEASAETGDETGADDSSDTSKNPETGAQGVSAFIAIALGTGALMLLSRKKAE